MPASTLTRSRTHRASRRKNPEANRPQPVAPIQISSFTKTGTALTLVFDGPVQLKGTPAFTTNLVGVTPVSAIKTLPNTVVVTFSASIATATSLNLGFRDPSIRNASGGYVVSTTFPV